MRAGHRGLGRYWRGDCQGAARGGGDRGPFGHAGGAIGGAGQGIGGTGACAALQPERRGGRGCPAKAGHRGDGALDILVNNAGITRDQIFMRMSDEEWQSVIDVNLTSTMRLCGGVMRPMMKARWGRIINISSIVGATGNPGQVNYAASKAGMVGMTESIAYEVATRGITANCVAPGFIATAMTEKLTDDQKEAINAKIPAARMGTPEEIAAAVLYLASAEAGYVTGATLHVNGGMAMV